MLKQEDTLTRRSFIGATAAFGGVLAAAGALGGCAPKEGGGTAAIAPSGLPEKWDHEADVVIVGYGGAGAAAAWEALNAGSSVAILEMMSMAGGSTSINGGYITMAGTPLQKELGFDDNADNLYNYMLASGGLGVSEAHCRILADNSTELYDWLTDELGVVFAKSYQGQWPEPANHDAGLTCTGDEFYSEYAATGAVPRSHWVEGFTTDAPTGYKNGSGYFKPLFDAVESMAPDVFYDTPAKQLIYHTEQGRVVGVIAGDKRGEFTVKANKAVILTAGGFAMNKDMLEQYCPMVKDCNVIGTAGDDGSGIRMGQGVGADVIHMQDVYGHLGLDMGTLVGRDGFAGGPLSFGVFVSKRGQRFVSEDRYHTMAPARMFGPDFYTDFSPAYLVCDSYAWSQVPAEETPSKENGLLAATADTVEGLAAALGMPDGALEATIAFYNSHAENGDDPLFGKNSRYIKPIVTPPFYAVVASAGAGGYCFTTGGLRIDTDCHVLGALDQRLVPGLYSAGRNSSDVFGTVYQESGLSVASCYTFGRIAGRNAAAETPWE
jgi:3-oxo-5alpha-steroid 4-dehydrogenase